MSDKQRGANLLVIDTQVLLEWLLFRDRSAAGWSGALRDHTVRWIACPAMRIEFAHMAGHARFQRWQVGCEHMLSTFDQHALMVEDPTASQPALRCRDPDDQVFIDLALAHGARWLLSRDKDLRALARRAAARGLWIGPPEQWPGPDNAAPAAP
jgi:uncharacterized protein